MPMMPLPFARQSAVLRCALFPLRLQSSRAYYVCIGCAKGSKRNAQHALTVFEDCSPSLASSCRKAPESCAPICKISWKMRPMTSQAQPALRYSVHSCIGKSSMNIFTGVSSVLPLTVKKMHRCSELPPSRAWGHSLHQRWSPLWATSSSL